MFRTMHLARAADLAVLFLAIASAGCGDYEWQKRTRQAEKDQRDQAAAVRRAAEDAQRAALGAAGAAAPRAGAGRRVAGTVNRAAGERLSESNAAFESVRGYLVRGTDESSFLLCGSRVVHYARVSPAIASRITQYYRFRAPQLLQPVYFEVKGRVVPDTVTIGSNTYTSVLEISGVDFEKMTEPRCATPGAGSLIAASRND